MIIFKFGLLLMLHIDLISTFSGVVYLKREKRKLESAHNIEATFDDFAEPNSSDEKEKRVNPLSKFYDSQDSAVGSGESNGSGLAASGGNVEESGWKRTDEFVGSASGDVTGENDDMDASFAQLIGGENEDQRDIISSGSGYNGQFFAASEQPVSDGAKASESDEDISGSTKGLNNITFAETGAILKMLAPKDDENQSQTSSLEKPKEKRELKNEIGIGKRSLETEKKMSLLQEFFNLMSSTDDVEKRNKELRKRNIEDDEGEMEEFREHGDNAVRFLEEVNTENMFTTRENEMLERITRGKGSDEDSLDSSVLNVDEQSMRKRDEASQFPMIRMSKRNMLRPSKGAELPMATTEGTGAEGENVGRKDKREAEDFQLKMEKDSEKTSRREKRQDINTVSDLTPLNNEYLQNLESMKDQINLMESKRDLTNRFHTESEIDEAAMNLHSPTKTSQKNEQKQVSLIGIHNKPTQVAGFWSGLGSQPIFVEKHPEELASGSGLEEIMNLSPVSNSGSLGKKKSNRGKEKRQEKRKFKPEEIGGIMDHKESRYKKERGVGKGKDGKKAKSKKEKKRREKIRKRKADREDKKKDQINAENMNDGGTETNEGTSQAVLAFDELHEIVAKNVRKNGVDDMGDNEESGDEETVKEIRSYPEDEVVVKTLSATYRQNDVIDKRSRIIVKRAPYDGYIGCYVDVLHPIRDLAVRAGIPFVTISNCRSACKRTGYYYAGLQFGYLCFCGNSYGKYDMAPDSECNYACSGDGNQTCGGLWRNSVYFTAGAPDHSNEGPVPFYLPPTDKGALTQINGSNIKRSEIPQSPPYNYTYSTNTTYTYPPTQNTTSQLTQATQATQTTQSQAAQTTPPQAAQYTTSNYNATANDVIKTQSNAITNKAVTTSEMPRNQSENPGKEDTGVKMVNGKRKVLMHFAYLHPQEHREIRPTKPPAPTPPLRIEPQTRVFKGEIKLKQKWFDEFKDKMSTKSLILAGNVEQALKNIYGNSSNKNDFLKAEVLSFREGLIKNNPYTVTKTIVEFTLTFDQNAISPDAKLFSKVRATKRLDEMPVYPKSLKVSEYRFDPNSPNQAFKIPMKAPVDSLIDNGNDDEESRKSTIAQPNNQSPITENVIASSSIHQQSNQLNTVSENMKELQDYLVSEKSLPPSANGAVNLRDANRARFATNVPGVAAARSNIVQESVGYSKRSNVQPSNARGEKVPYILRLFFWKDMLARRKRFSSNEKLSTALTRGRRGEVDDFKSDKVSTKADDKLKNNKLRIKRLENKRIPLTQNKLSENRFMKKMKRRTKDLTTEKELKRSKRLDDTKSYAYTAKVSSEPESCREVMILDDTLIVFGINVSDNYVHVIMLIMIE
eukprot:Seg768.11 transcript_id=Seg768.11/GoldUCD/mRNA.D3Y31 product="Kremen protein 1" protein_id=Seg768.11/GoldUCD/D3Y31